MEWQRGAVTEDLTDPKPEMEPEMEPQQPPPFPCFVLESKTNSEKSLILDSSKY